MGQTVRLGFNLLLWTSHVTDAHRPILDALKRTGYDGAEIPMFEGDVAHYREVGRWLREAGLATTGIGIMPGPKSAVSPDRLQREGALDHIKWLVDCTEAIGGDVVAGPLHQPLGEFTGRGPTAEENGFAAEVLNKAAAYAAQAKMAVAIEPLNRFECYFLNTARQAAELVKAVGAPNFGYLYDTFHFNIEEDDPVAVIPETIGAIKHVHISENNRGTPGAGHIAFQPVFSALKSAGYDGWMTIEAFGSALPDLAAATRIWRTLFRQESDVYGQGYALMRQGWDRA